MEIASRSYGRMASDAGFDCTVETFERVSTDDGLRFRETGFRGPETTRPKSPRGPIWSQQRPTRPRQCPPIAGHSEAARKSPRSRECVVGLEGLERPNRRL